MTKILKVAALSALVLTAAGCNTLPIAEEGALQVDDDERQRRYEAGWEAGSLFGILTSFADLQINQEVFVSSPEVWQKSRNG